MAGTGDVNRCARGLRCPAPTDSRGKGRCYRRGGEAPGKSRHWRCRAGAGHLGVKAALPLSRRRVLAHRIGWPPDDGVPPCPSRAVARLGHGKAALPRHSRRMSSTTSPRASLRVSQRRHSKATVGGSAPARVTIKEDNSPGPWLVEESIRASSLPASPAGRRVRGWRASGVFQLGWPDLVPRILWVPTMSLPHATCECSWIRPSSRSRRRTRMLSPAGAPWDLPSGGLWPRARCGPGCCSVGVFAEGVVEMLSAGEEDPVRRIRSVHSRRALGIHRSQIAFARRLDRRGDDPRAGRSEDGVERVGVLGIAVPDQELQAAGLFAEVYERVARTWSRAGQSVSGGVFAFHVLRNPAAVAYLEAFCLGPFAHGGAVLTVGGRPAAGRGGTADFPGVRHVFARYLVQGAAILAAEVDFPGLPVEADCARLGVLRAAADVTGNRYRDLLCHSPPLWCSPG